MVVTKMSRPAKKSKIDSDSEDSDASGTIKVVYSVRLCAKGYEG